MMVKRTLPLFIPALTLFLAGCPVSRAPLRARVETTLLATGRLSGPVSLLESGDSLVAVFSDRDTTSLAVTEVPLGPELPRVLPPPQLVDRIDVAPPLTPDFGDHAAAAGPGGLSILYLDREKDDRHILKLITRPPGASQWRLEVVEPSGRPVALLPRPDGALDTLWAPPQSLLYRPARGAPQGLLDGFQLGGRASPLLGAEERGFTAFDEASQELVWCRIRGETVVSGRVGGVGHIHAATLRPGPAGADRLAIVSYDPARRRIFLHEENEAADFARTTVTICDGTRMLFLAPWGRGYIFLFDERRALGGGREAAELSMLAPVGARYRKQVLASGKSAFDGVAAVLRGDTLHVLALQDDRLSLLGVTLTAGTAAR